jgi:hypothetical protein
MPVFVLGGGKSERLESSDSLVPQRLEPTRNDRLAVEILSINPDRAGCARRHGARQILGRETPPGTISRDRRIFASTLFRSDVAQATAPAVPAPCSQS